MSQEEVLEYLNTKKEPVRISEIYQALPGLSPRLIRRHITQLLKYGEINCIEIDRDECKKRYKTFGRRMMLYYI